MSAFSPEQQDELTRLIQMQVARSDLATLVRQLQGGASFPADAGKRRASTTVTVTWPGGSATAAFVTVTHNWGVVPRVIAQPQDQAGVGYSIPALSITSTKFDVNLSTLGFTPSAGTKTDISVIYWEP